MIYLASYRPLIVNRDGRAAVDKYGLPPFVDASCRRERDFENPRPSISAICRSGKFAPHLRGGDVVVYLTVKGQYLQVKEPRWRLVAILEVSRKFDSHAAAADWYRAIGLSLPCNCVVTGNGPLPLDQTMGRYKRHGRVRRPETVEEWDLGYVWRSRKWRDFAVCEARFLELSDPPIIDQGVAREVFAGGRVPVTRTPQSKSAEELRNLEACAWPGRAKPRHGRPHQRR